MNTVWVEMTRVMMRNFSFLGVLVVSERAVKTLYCYKRFRFHINAVLFINESAQTFSTLIIRHFS